MLKTVKLKIDGMHCSSCAMMIDGDLEDMEGVERSSTKFAKSETEVEFEDSVIDLPKILESVKSSGYTAKILD